MGIGFRVLIGSWALTLSVCTAYLAVHFLLLKIVSAVGMGLVLKQADVHGLSRLSLIRINYAVAAMLAFLCAVAADQTLISRPTALLGCATGVLFVVGLVLWVKTIETAGLTLSIVAMRTAVVVPVLASFLLWQERPTLLELAGAAAALVALGLVLWDVVVNKPQASGLKSLAGAGQKTTTSGLSTLDCPESAVKDSKSIVFPTWAWLFALFLADGLVMTAAQVFRKEMPQKENLPFQTVIFISAFAVTSVIYFLRRTRTGRPELSFGAMLGVANLGNYVFLVLALALLPGIVVYPVLAAAEVGLLSLAGVLIWKEGVGVRSWCGIGLAVIALVLVQLGRPAV